MTINTPEVNKVYSYLQGAALTKIWSVVALRSRSLKTNQNVLHKFAHHLVQLLDAGKLLLIYQKLCHQNVSDM